GLGAGRDQLALAALSAKLPAGDYEIAADGGYPFASIAAGWADGAYRFDGYRTEKAAPPRLLIPASEDAPRLSREANAVSALRDLVNTPAAVMGPEQIHARISALGERHGARAAAVVGDALIDENYPVVHAVGRAAVKAPR